MNREMRRASKANGRNLMRQGWAPFVDSTNEAHARARLFGHGLPAGLQRMYLNPLYTVQVFLKQTAWGEVTHLMVRRNDEGPIRSWADMQRVKNEIMGPDRVAVEVYPAERDLIDQANIYHLWVLPVGFALPFGLHARGVL